MEEFDLPDDREVRRTDRALENLNDDHDDCAFCLGRSAAHRGDSKSSNPYSPDDRVSNGAVKWYDTDHGLWLAGYDLGSTEPGGLLWFEQPNRET